MIRILILFVFIMMVGFISCQKDSIPPNAVIVAFPQTADSTIILELNASGSAANSTYLEGLLFSWDFESDGQWDVQNQDKPICLKKFDKPGKYLISLKVEDHFGFCDYDSTLVTIYPANTQVGRLIDSRDGKVYKTVLLNNSWWMAENLDYGNWINSGQEQENNQIPEKYYFKDDSTGFASNGGIYKWEEANNYSTNKRGICPEGWHMPDSEDWKSLLDEIDLWYAWQYFGPNGLSGFEISEGHSARREYDVMKWDDKNSTHWARDYYQFEFLREQAPYVFHYSDLWGDLGLKYIRIFYDGSDQLFLQSSNYASVRCVKNK